MVTNKVLPADLIEATQLTRAGRLLEATALIQRALGSGSPFTEGAHHAAASKGGASSEVIDVDCVEVPERTHGALPSPQEGAGDDASPGTNLQNLLRKWARRTSTIEVPPVRPAVADGQPGQFVAGSYSNQHGARPYKLYVPTSYAGQSLPLVVMLHGCTQTPDDFAKGTRMNALAEEQPCFVLYPEQTQAANPSRCWNWFKRGDQLREQGEPAILAGMTREILKRYRIDPGKVYVAGLSAGGAMAAVMGMAYPELYAAVGIHSGLTCGSAQDLPSALAAMRGIPTSQVGRTTASRRAAPATPTIVFHGDRDKTVHPCNGEQVVRQSVERNGTSAADATTERGQAPDGHAYTRTIHRDSTGRVVLEHWLVHGGGHAWFGGSARGSYTDPKGPDAAREMMRFFRKNAAQRYP
jgi:poly(hydroxyalkanoate) depolymerase family esterase